MTTERLLHIIVLPFRFDTDRIMLFARTAPHIMASNLRNFYSPKGGYHHNQSVYQGTDRPCAREGGQGVSFGTLASSSCAKGSGDGIGSSR